MRRSAAMQVSRKVAAEAAQIVRAGGVRVSWLGLHLVPGVVWVEIRDATTARMRAGEAHVVVWGGKPEDVWAMLQRHRPRGVELTCEVRRPNRYRRALSWVRWAWWRWKTDRKRKRV